MLMALVKSRSETSGATAMLILLLASTVGVKVSEAPNCLNRIEMTPSACGTGIGNSPPARKLASCPLNATSVGSARIFTILFCFNASMNPVHVIEPV